MEEEGEAYDRRQSKSSGQNHSSFRHSGPCTSEVVPRRDMYSFVESLLHDAMEDDRVMDLAERTVIDAIDTCNVDHNKAFIKCTLLSALINLLMSILEDESRIK